METGCLVALLAEEFRDGGFVVDVDADRLFGELHVLEAARIPRREQGGHGERGERPLGERGLVGRSFGGERVVGRSIGYILIDVIGTKRINRYEKNVRLISHSSIPGCQR